MGVQLDWVEADAEDLPFPAGSFDVVLSCIGVMFAPDHARTAGELVRVCRPGGTIALANWTPDGYGGAFFRVLGGYAPPPPSGAVLQQPGANRIMSRSCSTARCDDLRCVRRRVTLAFTGSPQELFTIYRTTSDRCSPPAPPSPTIPPGWKP